MGTVSQASRNMKAFVIVALVAAVSGEADPYTIGQVLAGQTNGGVLTSTTYHGGVKVAGFPYTKVAAIPAVSYAAAYPYAHAGVYYGKREAEAEPWTVGQIAAGAHVAEAIKDGRAHNVGVITNAAIAPVAATHVYSAYPYAHYPYAYYGKREAEADPGLVYSTGLVGAYPYALGAHAVTRPGLQHRRRRALHLRSPSLCRCARHQPRSRRRPHRCRPDPLLQRRHLHQLRRRRRSLLIVGLTKINLAKLFEKKKKKKKKKK